MEPTYWLDLFTGTTWREFLDHGGQVSGFRESRWNTVKRIKRGDFLVCYLTGVQRWAGILRVVSEAFKDTSPLWKGEVFPSRLRVEPLIALTPETSVPMSEVIRDFVTPAKWGGLIRGSPTRIPTLDGTTVHKALEAARSNPVARPVDPRKLARVPRTYRTKIGTVTIPGDETADEKPAETTPPPPAPPAQAVTHEEIQWLLLKLGSDMGLGVWVARNDRNRQFQGQVLGGLVGNRKELPQQFDEATNRTIALIDVLWLQGNAIMAAFEVEHTTSIYSGLLRMSDLISMQPNLKIQLFIVASDERRDKVVEEINRPTFSKLSPPINVVCRFIPYSAIKAKLAQVGNLARYLRPEFLMDISESCEPPQLGQ
jgi:hypothetical protein